MTKLSNVSQRIALATAVSLMAIACSPINAQGDMQDTAALQDEDKAADKKGVFIVKRGGHGKGEKSVDVRVMHVDVDGGKPHKIKIKRETVGGKVTTEVEGGELTKDSEGNEVVIYTDDDGKKHEYKIESSHNYSYTVGDQPKRVWVQSGEHRVARVPRVDRVARTPRTPRAHRSHEMRIDMERANVEIAKAKDELKVALDGVEKELADIKDKDSAEYEGLEIAKSAIKSAMDSLKDQHFDGKKMQIELRKMDKMILRELNEAMEDVHGQRDIIIDLQVDIQEEVEDAREEMRDMIIEIEEMDDGEERELRLKVVGEMEEAMKGMAEVRLKALKKAEDELRKSRIELEKQIAEEKAQAAKDEKPASEDSVKDDK